MNATSQPNTTAAQPIPAASVRCAGDYAAHTPDQLREGARRIAQAVRDVAC